MKREVAAELDRWLASPGRRPLVLRGARQVGKTWLVRDLATRAGRHLVEINLERNPRLARHFDSNQPRQILAELSVAIERAVTPGECLLFLDEIQAAPALLSKLRWFAEELPSLPVIAAGSLLEFALADHAFRMPVGRVSYRHIEPMGFPEYLHAHGQDRLATALSTWRPGAAPSLAVHEKAATWFHRYSMVGGMPAVVAVDVEQGDPRACRALQRDLLATYRADFAGYAGRMDRNVLDSVLHAVARSVGRKFVYARVEDGVKQHQAKRALELLAGARLCHLVRWSAAGGLPLAGETKDTFRKAIVVDVGLLHALLGTPAAGLFSGREQLAPAVRAALADQLAGQQLRLMGDASGDGPALYYWQREGGRPGEIDYLLQHGGRIVPVELKAGTAGAMKSLHQFMFDKRLRLAVRIDANPPSRQKVSVVTTQGDRVRYQLLSVPMHLAWALAPLLGP